MFGRGILEAPVMHHTIRLVAIAGASCSGKTALARALAEALGQGRVLSMDWYYGDLSGLRSEERVRHNFDHPATIDYGLLLSQLEALLVGEAIEAPRYDFKAHVRETATRRVEPAQWIILEGVHALYWEEIRRKASTTVFVELDHGTCLKRRIQRDIEERGRNEEAVRAQYTETVQPMFERYVAPLRACVGVVARGDHPVAESVREIVLSLEGRGEGHSSPNP